MNEKIKLLAEQAGATVMERSGWTDYGTLGLDVEKFAELIIKECAGVAVRVGDCNNDIAPEFGQGAYFSADQIKQYFGVKDDRDSTVY